MKCPFCGSPYELTWEKRFSAPFGHHVCPECFGKFREKYTLLSYLLIIIATLFSAIPFGILGILHVFFMSKFTELEDFPSVIICYLIGIFFVIFPVDKFISGRFNKAVPFQAKDAITTRKVITQIIFYLFILFLFGLSMIIVPEWLMGDRRFEIYAIASELKAGMPREEVITIIKQKNLPHVKIIYSKEDNSIMADVSIGLARYCSLSIEFTQDGVLKSSRIRGEDGAHQKFRDAPPDIIPETAN